MEPTLQQSFTLWDRQCHKQAVEKEMTKAYIQLNNLYLSIERGEVELNIHTANMLRSLAVKSYWSIVDPMVMWWANEFTKLDGWFEV